MTMTPKIKSVQTEYGVYWVVMWVSHNGSERFVKHFKKPTWKDAVDSLRNAYYWGDVLNGPDPGDYTKSRSGSGSRSRSDTHVRQ